MKHYLIILLFTFTIISAQNSIINKPSELIRQPEALTIESEGLKLWIGEEGYSSHNKNGYLPGLFFPKDSDKTLAYADGPVIGYLKDDTTKVQASYYYYGFTGGRIESNGSFSEPDDPRFGVYKAKKNWESITDSLLKEQYKYVHDNWPADLGAPFDDVNNDGIYQPESESPLIPYDEATFSIAHCGIDSIAETALGSAGEKIEMHTFAYTIDPVNFPNVVIKKIKFINKSPFQLKDVYLGYFADCDIGDYDDDFVGCDSALQLMYGYNGQDVDSIYGSTPPALGYLLLQGPIVESTSDDFAFFNNSRVYGYKNLDMTSFQYYARGDGTVTDPYFGTVSHGDMHGYDMMYKNLQGLIFTGDPHTNPVTATTTKFMLNGDPVATSGWYDGMSLPRGDRRMMLATGKFDMAPNSVQEFVIAIFAEQGANRLESVTKLKVTATQLHEYYTNSITTGLSEGGSIQPIQYQLAQNYPNPFNPSTVIEFSLPEQSNVQLEVFNILGEKVADLVNAEMNAGVHKVNFDGASLTSGVYVYRLKVGSVHLVRKMMLLK